MPGIFSCAAGFVDGHQGQGHFNEFLFHMSYSFVSVEKLILLPDGKALPVS